METNIIVSKALEYVGTPFHHQGRLKGVGVDCVGLIVCSMLECGMKVSDLTNYSRVPQPHVLLAKLEEHLEPIEKHELKPGDIILFRFMREPQHVALYNEEAGIPYIIHSYESVGKVVSHVYDAVWKKRALAYYRIRT